MPGCEDDWSEDAFLWADSPGRLERYSFTCQVSRMAQPPALYKL